MVSPHTTQALIPFSTLDSDAIIDKYDQSYTHIFHTVPGLRWFHELFFTEILRYLPIFSFYISKVDKRKRKHSRGKSGKYMMSWKYVPPYRRITVVLRWLVRDIRFQKSHTFQNSVLKSFQTLMFNSQSHLVYKLRNFVHLFVFQNYKKKLLKTLKSV
jgi:hypothetical protein